MNDAFQWNEIASISLCYENNQFMTEFYVANKPDENDESFAIHVEERFYVSQKWWYDKD